MIRARHVSLALALVALVALGVGTGAFSSMTVERGVAIAVVDDERAYFGVVPEDVTATNGNETRLFTLTNRFGTTLALDTQVDGTSGNITVSGIETPDSLGVGESGPVNATVECGENASGTVTIRLEASGAGVQVTMERRVTVECTTGGVPATPEENESVGSMNKTVISPRA